MNEAQEILKQVSVYSYAGIFVISLLANVFIPVPEEVVILMIGYGVGTGLFSLWPTLGITFVGLLISDIGLYYFASRGTRWLTWVYEKYFGSLGLTKNESFLKTHINKVIFFSRFIVQFRFLGPFLAGYFHVPFKRFLKFEIPALVLYVPLMFWLGSYFESRINSVINGIGSVKNIIIIVIGVILAISLIRFIKAKFVQYLTNPHMEKVKKFMGRGGNGKDNTVRDEVVIVPKGSYFSVDDEGFLVNPAHEDNIQTEWKPLIEDIVEAYKKFYGSHLKNVYIRGSVAKGEAIPNVSDIDTFAYTDLDYKDLNEDGLKELRGEIIEKYPFVTGIEMEPDSLENATGDSILLNQSLCVYGELIVVPKMKPGKNMSIHASGIRLSILKAQEFFKEDHSPEEVQAKCTWMMKVFLRTGFEITMERSQKYTRDLYRCYETFSEYYPEKEPEMREVLHLALNPTADRDEVVRVMDNFGAWLVEETGKWFVVKE